MPPVPASLAAFSLPGLADFVTTAGGLLRLDIRTPLAEAQIYLHGGHVAHFQPANGRPVLFMSRESHFLPGKPIRGGVPICFPWFGPRAGDPKAPMHGFARLVEWAVESVMADADGAVTVVLRLDSTEATKAWWPHDFVLRHRVSVGGALRMSLEVANTGSAPFTIEEAQHTYLAVSDVRSVAICGLENAHYLDKADGFAAKTLGAEPLRITAETDRVFPGHHGTCTIEDPAAGRTITIEKSGSATTVVWNPWIAKAAAMADFGDDEWPQMLCIETANTGDDAVTIAPGATHAMVTTVKV